MTAPLGFGTVSKPSRNVAGSSVELFADLSAVPTMTARPPSLPPGAAALPSESVRPGTSGGVLSSLQPPGTFTEALVAAAEPVSAPVSAAGSVPPPPPPEPPSRKPSTSARTAPTPSAIGNALLLGFSPSRTGLAFGSALGLAAFGAFGSFGLRSFLGLAFGSGFWRSASGMTVAFGSYS